MNIRLDSTEYIYSTVTADHDLTGKTIEVALPVKGTTPTDWYATAVTGVVTNTDGTWTATYRVLVGPNGPIQLAVGAHDFIMRLTDSPEQPVRKTGSVTVTAV